MNNYAIIAQKMLESIFGSDIFILFAGIATLVFMISTLLLANAIKRRTKEWEKNKNVQFSKFLLHGTSMFYTLFVTFISIVTLLALDIFNPGILKLRVSSKGVVVR